MEMEGLAELQPGQTLKLLCRVESAPNANFTWMNGTAIIGNSAELSTNVTLYDNGVNFTCCAENNVTKLVVCEARRISITEPPLPPGTRAIFSFSFFLYIYLSSHIRKTNPLSFVFFSRLARCYHCRYSHRSDISCSGSRGADVCCPQTQVSSRMDRKPACQPCKQPPHGHLSLSLFTRSTHQSTNHNHT